MPPQTSRLLATPCSRRRFLTGVATASAALAAAPRPLDALAAALAADVSPRELSLVHTHTAETLTIVYWKDGAYLADALARIDHLLRDWRTGDVAHIDPQLLDLLHELARATGAQEPYHVICGYRTEDTNAALRARSSGVAAKSQHLLGRAIDVRLPGVPTTRLRDVARTLRRGGVGYYQTSDFVHVDTGRVRRW